MTLSLLLATGPGPRATEPALEHVEISAPILPRVLVLYQSEGEKFPVDSDAQAALVHQVSLTFDFLLQECPANYPDIVIPQPGDPPTTPAQNARNFDRIAACSYEKYTAKPYWIPALVDQVDICGNELGVGWHLPTEAEVNGLDQSDRQAIAHALATPDAQTLTGFGNFYFRLEVWVRGKDGSLRLGDLSPGATNLVYDSPVPATSTSHYERGVALRCVRRTATDSPPGEGGAAGTAGAGGGGSAGASGTGVAGNGIGPEVTSTSTRR